MRNKRNRSLLKKGDALRYHEQWYDIEEILGSGGGGLVLLVKNRNLKNLSVIKVLHPDLAREERYVKRFEDEARVLAGLEDLGLVKVLQQGRLSDPVGLPFMQMEYTKGQTLREALRSEGKFPVARALVILNQTLSVMAKFHKAGIIHRDIKPENILLVNTPLGLVVKIFDFGIFLHDERAPDEGSFVGTVGYVSPEQTLGFDIDGRSDVYSVGVIAYEMLTGKRPFSDVHDGSLASVYKTIGLKAPSVITIDPSIPIEVSEFVDALLEQDVSTRPTAEAGAQRAKAVQHQFFVHHGAPQTMEDAQVPTTELERIDIEDLENRTSPDGRISTFMKGGEDFGKAETERDTAHRIQQSGDTARMNELESGERTKIPDGSDPQESSSSIDAYFDSLGASEPPNPISDADEADVNDRARLVTTERVEPTVVSQSEDRTYGKDDKMVVAQRADGTLRRGDGEVQLPDPPNRAFHPEENKQNLKEEKPSEKYTTIRSRRDQIEEAEAIPASEDLTDEEVRAKSKELADEAVRVWRVDLQGEEALLAFRRDYAAAALQVLQADPSEKTIRRLRGWIAEAAADQAGEAAERQGSKGHASGVPEQPQQEAHAQQGSNAPNDASHVESESEGSTDEEVRAVCEALVDETIRALRPLLPNYTSEEQLVDHRELGKIYLEHLRANPSEKTVRAIRAQIAKFAAKLAAERQGRKGYAESMPEPPQQEANAQEGGDAPATNRPAPSNPASDVNSDSEGPTDEELRAVSEELADEAIRAWRLDRMGEEKLFAYRRDYAVAVLRKLQANPSEKTVRAIRAQIAKFAAELAAKCQEKGRANQEGRDAPATNLPASPNDASDVENNSSEGLTDEELCAVCEELVDEAARVLMPNFTSEEQLAPRRKLEGIFMRSLRADPSEENIRSIREMIATKDEEVAAEPVRIPNEPAAATLAPVVSHRKVTWTSVAIYGLLLAISSILVLGVLHLLGYFDIRSILTRPEPGAAPPPLVEPAARAVTPPSPAAPASAEAVPPSTPKIAPSAVKRPVSPVPSSSARETDESLQFMKENRRLP